MNDKPHVVGAAKLVQRIKKARLATAALVADPEIGRILLRRVRGRFEKGVAPDGSKWDPLEEITIRKKERKGYTYPKKPLQATGVLYDALQIIQGSNAGLLAGNTGSGFRIGIDDPEASRYGRIHNYGYGLPERRFIGMGTGDVEAVRGFLARRMKSIANGG